MFVHVQCVVARRAAPCFPILFLAAAFVPYRFPLGHGGRVAARRRAAPLFVHVRHARLFVRREAALARARVVRVRACHVEKIRRAAKQTLSERALCALHDLAPSGLPRCGHGSGARLHMCGARLGARHGGLPTNNLLSLSSSISSPSGLFAGRHTLSFASALRLSSRPTLFIRRHRYNYLPATSSNRRSCVDSSCLPSVTLLPSSLSTQLSSRPTRRLQRTTSSFHCFIRLPTLLDVTRLYSTLLDSTDNVQLYRLLFRIAILHRHILIVLHNRSALLDATLELGH